MRKHKTHRVNLELGPKTFSMVNQLQRDLEADSTVEVVRLAIRVLHAIAARDVLKVEIQNIAGDWRELLLPKVVR